MSSLNNQFEWLNDWLWNTVQSPVNTIKARMHQQIITNLSIRTTWRTNTFHLVARYTGINAQICLLKSSVAQHMWKRPAHQNIKYSHTTLVYKTNNNKNKHFPILFSTTTQVSWYKKTIEHTKPHNHHCAPPYPWLGLCPPAHPWLVFTTYCWTNASFLYIDFISHQLLPCIFSLVYHWA